MTSCITLIRIYAVIVATDAGICQWLHITWVLRFISICDLLVNTLLFFAKKLHVTFLKSHIVHYIFQGWAGNLAEYRILKLSGYRISGLFLVPDICLSGRISYNLPDILVLQIFGPTLKNQYLFRPLLTVEIYPHITVTESVSVCVCVYLSVP